MTSKIFWLLIALLMLLVGCQSQGAAPASPDRLEDVAVRGASVMPFDLERSTHIFQKPPLAGYSKCYRMIKTPGK